MASSRKRLSYPLWHPYIPMNDIEKHVTMLVEGKGCRVRDQRGKEYIDASGGLWSVQCGLGHTDIIDAITAQLRRLSYGTLFDARSNELSLELARELVAMAPAPLQWAYLTGSGSEAVELSIKVARLHFALRGKREKKGIVYLDRSYHGTFFGSMGVSALLDQKEEFAPLLPGLFPIPAPTPDRHAPGVSYVDFAVNCARRLEEIAVRKEIAAFIAEPVLGAAGVVIPPREYFQTIQEICRRHEILLILDEVATGFGRTGKWFAAEHFDLQPDMLLLAKGINSGYLPLGAVLFSEEIGNTMLQHNSAIGHGSSHNGNPVCCAAALATIEVIRREGLLERAAEQGAYFCARLDELRRYSCVKDVRAIGLMAAVEFTQEDGSASTQMQVEALNDALKRAGVLAYVGGGSLVFCPALIITREEIDVIVESLSGVLSGVRLRGGGLEFEAETADVSP